mgnify:CR=1 FL=1
MKKLLFLILFIPFAKLNAQVESNEYFEVIYSIDNPIGRYHSFENGTFGINYKDGDTTAVWFDSLGNELIFPCDYFRNYKMDPDLINCYQDTLLGIYSLSQQKFTTPLVDSIYSINANFYATQENGVLKLFNREHQELYAAKTNRPLDKFYQKCGQNHVVIYDDKQKYMHVSGEMKEYKRCATYLPTFADGSYQFLSKDKIGLKSKAGDILIPAEYEYIKKWIDDKYIVTDVFTYSAEGIKPQLTNLYGVIDLEGNWILPMEYEDISGNSYGLAVKNLDQTYSMLSTDLENVYERNFERILAFENGLIILKDSLNNYYDLAYDSLGWQLNSNFQKASIINSNLSFVDLKNDKKLVVNRHGDIVFETELETNFKKLGSQFIAVKNEKGNGVMTNDGDWLINPANNQFISLHYVGGFISRDNATRKTDLYNSKGIKIAENIELASMVTPQYAYILSDKNAVGVMNDKGEIIIPFSYQNVQEVSGNPRFYQITENNTLYLVQLK